MKANKAVSAVLLVPFVALLLALAVLPLGCVAAPVPVAVLERPERPKLMGMEKAQAAIKSVDIDALAQLYALDILALITYARKLEALLDAVERQKN